MNIEEVRGFCLYFKGVTEEQPFGPDNVVYKVMGKMFALLSLDEPRRISLKNTPEKNIELCNKFDFIEGAWHMNKLHWSMITLDATSDNKLIEKLISDSYYLVVSKLTKKMKQELEDLD